METGRIVIVGAGLAGLCAAFQLEQNGIEDYVVLEARDVVGGRIASAFASDHPAIDLAAGGIEEFDLGPAWFWPEFQPQLDRLVHELGLERFEQFETGDTMVERSPNGPPIRMRGYVSSPPSMRLVGGMSALTNALRRRLEATRIITNQAVHRVRATDPHLEVDSEDSEGQITTWCAEHVLLAMPPRLAARRVEFSPALPPALSRQWRDTPTWMAPHAKYFAIYGRPFWREQGLSGSAHSAVGPLVEIHDASIPGGSAALFGFFGVPATVRSSVSEDDLRAHCRAQLVRLFGREAATPQAELIKDWAQESYTATPADQEPSDHHASAPLATPDTGPWQRRLIGIASEWSPQFPGYVAGAIEAASLGIAALPSPTMGRPTPHPHPGI